MKKTWNVLTGLVLVASLLSACGGEGEQRGGKCREQSGRGKE